MTIKLNATVITDTGHIGRVVSLNGQTGMATVKLDQQYEVSGNGPSRVSVPTASLIPTSA